MARKFEIGDNVRVVGKPEDVPQKAWDSVCSRDYVFEVVGFNQIRDEELVVLNNRMSISKDMLEIVNENELKPSTADANQMEDDLLSTYTREDS